jgi:hypothetical protein
MPYAPEGATGIVEIEEEEEDYRYGSLVVEFYRIASCLCLFLSVR